MKNKRKVVILGAGPVGLILGWLMAKKGWSVEIYEKNNIVGGLCRSWSWKNFILDTGPHIFHTNNLGLWKFWKKNFGNILIEGKYFAKNVIDNNFDQMHSYPISIQGINKLPKEKKNKILNELKKTKKNFVSKNFKEHIQNQVGSTLQSMFFEKYPEKVWGTKTEEMTSDWAPKRIKLTEKIEPFFQKEMTAVGKFGTGKIYEKIKDSILKLNGKFFFNSEVANFDYINHQITKVHIKNKKTLNLKDKDMLISTLPLTLTARFLNYKSNLKFRGVRTVYIAINKKSVLPKKTHWIYYASENIIFNRISEPKSMSKYVTKNQKHTYLSAEITYSKNDNIDKIKSSTLYKKVVDDLVKTNLIKKENVLGVSENKEDFVYPVQFKDYKYELKKTKFEVSKYNNLFTLGSSGEFDYADSQILYLKCFDFAETISNKHREENQMVKNINDTQLNSVVSLNHSKVGEGFKPYIIAEAGLNHNGDIEIAKKLILHAKKSGCDAVKFQSFSAERRVSKKARSVNFVEKADGLQEDIHEMFDRLSINYAETRSLFKFSKKVGIEMFSTPFDVKDVDMLEKFGVNFYKIASVDLVNLSLIDKIGKTKKPLILSTGMSNLSNVIEAIEVFKKTGNKNLILLHCLSSYPANEKEMNLKVIQSLKKYFRIPIGLSDHYPGLKVSLMALALGANVIERHLTLDKKMEGPDHILSSEPHEMLELTATAKNINSILGDGEKKIQPSEYEIINAQRKCLYVNKDLKKHSIIKQEDISVKGPAGGLHVRYSNLVLNKKIVKKIEKDHPLTWSHFLK